MPKVSKRREKIEKLIRDLHERFNTLVHKVEGAHKVTSSVASVSEDMASSLSEAVDAATVAHYTEELQRVSGDIQRLIREGEQVE